MRIEVSESHRKSQMQIIAICVGLIGLVAIVYWPARKFGFVDFDDPGCVYQNPHVISGLNEQNIRWAFSNYWVGHWAPLTWISCQADQTFFHLDPGVMHVENVVLHGISTLLLLGLLIIATGKRWRSAFVAAVFAVHPLHVESVAWITERRDMISTPPLLGAMIAYVWYTRSANQRSATAWYLVSLLLFVISLLGKATGITLPLILLLGDFWPLIRIHRAGWTRLLIEKLPVVMIE
jgi:hypothetical protein